MSNRTLSKPADAAHVVPVIEYAIMSMIDDSQFDFQTESDAPITVKNETENPYHHHEVPWSRNPGAKRAASLLLILTALIAFVAIYRPDSVDLGESTRTSTDEAILNLTNQMQVDINQASVADLQVIPGIGPATARKIIAERETNGLFTSLDDLQRVKGIGPRTVEKIADYVVMTDKKKPELAGTDNSTFSAKAPGEAAESTPAESARLTTEGEPN